MIKSVTFTGESGYIITKIPEPAAPRKPSMAHIWGSDSAEEKAKKESEYQKKLDVYNAEMKEFKKAHRTWAYHKNDYLNPQLANNLLGRTFEFAPNKINVIFGPNASGKTTIIKNIAGSLLIDDGFTSLMQPLDLSHMLDDRTFESYYEKVPDAIEKKKLNSSVIEWDGAPVYFDNFSNRQTHGSIGDLCGSIINDIGDEILYSMNKDRISKGQNSIFILNRVIDLAEKHMSMADVLSKYENACSNEVWENCYKAQIEYFKQFPKYSEKSPMTVLFDEMDKSLDINNIIRLYRDYLPSVLDKVDIQMIIVSHSPVVLSDAIFNNPKYNIISMDEEYTKNCRENLKTMFLN